MLGQLDHEFIERVPGSKGQPHQEFTPGGHFIQDDCGEDIAAALIAWMAHGLPFRDVDVAGPPPA